MRHPLRPITALFASIGILAGCGVCRKSQTTQDRLETIIKVMEHTEYVPVLASFDIPVVKESLTTRDTTSHLENDYAQSDARINPDGSLFHSLSTKPQTIQTQTEAKVMWRDSIEYRDREVIKEVSVPVERKLSWWQRVRLDGFWILAALTLFAYRKELFALVRKLFV